MAGVDYSRAWNTIQNLVLRIPTVVGRVPVKKHFTLHMWPLFLAGWTDYS